MNPRLEVISGPRAGEVIQLPPGQEEIPLGRNPESFIMLDNLSVSKQHCRIQRSRNEFTVVDLGSHNGTYVNGLLVKQHRLRHGDQINIGNWAFRFLIDDSPEVSLTPVRLSERKLESATTVELVPAQNPYLSGEDLRAGEDRRVRDLNSLLRISSAIHSLRNLEALETRLVQLLVDVVPADRVAVILLGERTAEIASVFGQDRTAGADRPVEVSRPLIEQVLREGVAVLCDQESASLAGDTVLASRMPPTGSILVAPLVAFRTVRGAIYLDTSAPDVRFTQDDLHLVSAIGSIAALALENARRIELLESENQLLRAEVGIRHDMIGEGPAMQAVFRLVGRLARTDSTVLIRGESGTGKELVARAIHFNSDRKEQPFIAVNCAAITETLLESEMFGHVKGAFTDARADKKGKIELADGGTLFLDEIGEMAPALQAKLLRVLQEKEFERVGGTRHIKVDVRVIAATNKKLEEAVEQGAFRRDLFFRLNVVAVMLPPLRERREDIPVLAEAFLGDCAGKCKRHVAGISPEARAYLMSYDWPGNVRELQNAIERAVVLGSTELILPEDLPESLRDVEPPDIASSEFQGRLRDQKRQLVLSAFEKARGSYTETAKLLGLHPNYLHRLIRNLGLRAELQKRAAARG